MIRRVNSVNDNFFSKPNLLNSYWAGFIAADGCIIDKAHSQKLLVLELGIKEYKHLMAFKKAIDFIGKIGIYRKGRSCKFSITSDILCNALNENFKITPRKTFTLEPPENLNKEQTLAYIIGYIDGDGSILINKAQAGKYSYLAFDIVCTKSIGSYIKKHLGLSKIQIIKRPKENVHRVRFNGKTAIIIYKLLEKLVVPKLQRKWYNPEVLKLIK